jgi:stage V sporulation protein S
MHAMDDMDVPASVKVEDGKHNEYDECEEYDKYNRYDEDFEVLKVSAHSRPGSVAGAIAGVIRTYGRADVQAIGAGATNQAIKAIAIARGYLQPDGVEIVVVPAFIDVQIANEDRTAIRLVVEAR